MKKTIMIIDDDAHIREVMKLYHEEMNGFKAVTAMDGQDALAQLQTMIRNKSRLPDVLLVDLKMPFMDGATLMVHLSLDDLLGTIPRVVTSAACHDARTYRHFVLKPIDRQKMDNMLSAAMAETSICSAAIQKRRQDYDDSAR